jgi:hyaluronan synthase
MNDDSMLTFYGMLHGRTVHQASSIAFTIVPEKFSHYRKQQMRWMRGTFVRSFWWFRYLSPKDAAWWMPFAEIAQIFLSLAVMAAVVVMQPPTANLWHVAEVTMLVGAGLNYLTALRYFSIRRSDEPFWLQVLVFALAPVAGLWRFVVLRPMVLWAMVTCWKIQSWGTRATVEVALDS